ncbi:NAD(P)H-dependent oxidoreductase [Bacillus wiedmannii]|uniref:hypothetical protein n=1 Tax=Bacillus wiedmannii TaxID=1890302 RepID=UPI002E22D648|nr:NAD(P)H-dependent oxidoreductase [Bacillus wiedmannii]
MNVLIVYAHPSPSSFNAAILKHVQKGLLKGKKAWVINTVDSPLWYVALLYRSADWIMMKRGVLRFCGIRDIKRSVFQSVKTSKQEKREKWLLQIEEKARIL